MTAARRPNLFLIGAMKSGTNTLHRLLAAHPDVFMTSKPKEPNWFAGGNSAKSEDWYLGLFSEARNATYVGEASTDYTRAPRLKGAAEKIKRFSPEARILYIIRDPLDRALSHYWWDVQYSAEGRSFVGAASRSREIIDVGNYAMQLAPYLEIFGRDRVHVLTLEALTQDAPKVLSHVWDFLELAPADVTGGAPPQRFNPGRAAVPRIPGSALFSHLKETPLWAVAKSVVPAKVRRQTIAALARPVERTLKVEELNEAADALRPRLLEETRALSAMLGREFPEWAWLHGGPAPIAPR